MLFQGASIEKLAVKQSKLRVLDLGSNRFKTLPTTLLANSPRLNAVYLDDNRLSNCSQMHVLSGASDLEFVDLSENRLVELERRCVDALAAGVSVKLAGNPFRCSCETAAAAKWLGSAVVRVEVRDRGLVTCGGGTAILNSDGSTAVHGSWKCRWFADTVVAVIVLLVCVTLFILVLVFARRRLILLRLCRHNATPSGQNGSVSSITISNSCYGNRSGAGVAGNGVLAPGSDESNRRYSPLIEDDLPPSRDPQVPVVRAAAARGPEAAGVEAAPPRCVATSNGAVCRKQQSLPVNAGEDNSAPSCGEIDSEALLANHVTEMEESV